MARPVPVCSIQRTNVIEFAARGEEDLVDPTADLQSQVNCLREDRRLVESTAKVGDLVKKDRAVEQIVTWPVDGITIVDVPRYTMLASSHVPVYTELREVVAERIANGHKKIVFNLSQSGAIVPAALAS